MSANIVYQSNTDIVHFSQANPAYSTINDIHIYEELPDSINMRLADINKEGNIKIIFSTLDHYLIALHVL